MKKFFQTYSWLHLDWCSNLYASMLGIKVKSALAPTMLVYQLEPLLQCSHLPQFLFIFGGTCVKYTQNQQISSIFLDRICARSIQAQADLEEFRSLTISTSKVQTKHIAKDLEKITQGLTCSRTNSIFSVFAIVPVRSQSNYTDQLRKRFRDNTFI